MNDQHCALITFVDIHTALKAHHAENFVDKQQLRTEFVESSNNCLSKVSLETSPVGSSIVERSSSSSSSMTNETILDKTIPPIVDQERDKRTSRPFYSPEENTR